MPTVYKSNNEFTTSARTLRKKSTSSEYRLWTYLRDKRLGYKFRRQYPIGRYILDFYCVERKLAVELDGGQHTSEMHKRYDKQRTLFLNNYGITVIRFWDNEVLSDTDTVLEVISNRLRES